MKDLQRFINAQENGYSFGSDYTTALAEIRSGRKVSHWIWYVFPQIKGLGFSDTTQYFSISDMNEAVEYINHPVLSARLIEISSELLKLECSDPMAILGAPDCYKLRSCMTLFKYAKPDEPVFQQVLDKFFNGMEDYKTLKILGIKS